LYIRKIVLHYFERDIKKANQKEEISELKVFNPILGDIKQGFALRKARAIY
jgi:hypothetical protein